MLLRLPALRYVAYKPSLFCIILGILSALSHPPINFLLGTFIGIGGLFHILSNTSSKKAAFLIGWCFGFGFLAIGLYWVAIALFVDAEKFAWLLPLANIALPSALAVYYALAAYCYQSIRTYNNYVNILSFAAIWTIAEYLRGSLFTGFPWLLTGYMWSCLDEMIQSASLIGSYGLGFITTIIACLLASKSFKSAVAILIVLFSVGTFRLYNTPTSYNDVIIKVIQPNIKQSNKWDPNKKMDNLRQLVVMSKQKEDSNYIIWPEAAVPYNIMDHNVRTFIASNLRESQFIISGTITNKEDHWFNSITIIDSKGRIIDDYYKTHLLPFGEYIPFREWIPLPRLAVGIEDWHRGNGLKNITIGNLPTFTPLICYEAVFPNKSSLPNSKWILNVTNDAWFGNSFGPYQHFSAVRMRAVEQGLPLVRAANTGISAFVDPYGRVVKKSKLNTEAVLVHKLPINIPTTFYSTYGDYPVLIILVVILLFAVFNRKYTAKTVLLSYRQHFE
jgi:apolipoprotein N-acyltransferase